MPLIPDPAGAAPLPFPYLPMALPSELDQHFGIGASNVAGDRWTPRQMFAPRGECVSEHRFRPQPVFLIRSDGAAVVQPQLICNYGNFTCSWADRGGGFHGYTYRAAFR